MIVLVDVYIHTCSWLEINHLMFDALHHHASFDPVGPLVKDVVLH